MLEMEERFSIEAACRGYLTMPSGPKASASVPGKETTPQRIVVTVVIDIAPFKNYETNVKASTIMDVKLRSPRCNGQMYALLTQINGWLLRH